MKKGNRHLVIPTMAENTSKIINDQQENIQEQAKRQWDSMYPKVSVDTEDDVDPWEELEERQHGLDR